MNRIGYTLIFAALGACSWVPPGQFADAMDADGDGVLDHRFDGPDCDDFHSAVGDCDRDRDGERAPPFGLDCDDADPTIHPGAAELCDGIDRNCNGVVDDVEDPARLTAFYVDDDGDGFGTEEVRACEAPPGAAAQPGDCDDTDASVFPGAPEFCDDRDHDCDGSDHSGAVDPASHTLDLDGDGWGRLDDPDVVVACDAPDGFAPSGDCDDTDADRSPSAPERCNGVDDDCDALVDDDDTVVDAVVYSLDRDGDGYGGVGTEVVQCSDPSSEGVVYSIGAGVDCNDFDAMVTSERLWFADQDGDGFGDVGETGTLDCVEPAGFTGVSGDCDDADPAVNPDADERCDATDRNCDGSPDGGAVDAVVFTRDLDGDGWGGLAGTPIEACTAPVDLAPIGDCGDQDPEISPDAAERCNGVDDDCDGLVDDEDTVTDALAYSLDRDGDGLGGIGTTLVQCANPSTDTLIYVVAEGLDCNDFDATIGGEVPWFEDSDGDGYGVATATPVLACAQPPAHARFPGDCDDLDAAVAPDVPETCNGADDDCDGAIDEGALDFTFFRDDDGDGFGVAGTSVQGCVPPPGFAIQAGDCDDTSAGVHPLSLETCNGIDDDCDALVDDDDQVANVQSFYRDDDGDGFGVAATLVTACVAPPNHAGLAGDCDDTDPAVSPGALEVCNGVDDDCDALVDDDDLVAGQVRFWFDGDGDAHGRSDTFEDRCAPPPGFVDVGGDCDDDDPAVYATVSTLDETAAPADVQDAVAATCDGGLVRLSGAHALSLSIPPDRRLTLASLDPEQPALMGPSGDAPAITLGERAQLDVFDIDFEGPATTSLIRVDDAASLSMVNTRLRDVVLQQAAFIDAGTDAEVGIVALEVDNATLDRALFTTDAGTVLTLRDATFVQLTGGGIWDAIAPGEDSIVQSVWIEDVDQPVFVALGDTFSVDRDVRYEQIVAIDTPTLLTTHAQAATLRDHRWIRVGDATTPGVDISDSTVDIEGSTWIRSGGVFFTTDSILLFSGNAIMRPPGLFLMGGNDFPVQPPLPDCGTLRFNASIEDSLFLDHGDLAAPEAFLDKLPPEGVGKFADVRVEPGTPVPLILRANPTCKVPNLEEHTVEAMKLVRYDPLLADEDLFPRAILDYGAATPAGTSLFDPDSGTDGKITLGPNSGAIGGDDDFDQIEDDWELWHFGTLDNCAWREDYACGGTPAEHVDPSGGCAPDPLSANCP